MYTHNFINLYIYHWSEIAANKILATKKQVIRMQVLRYIIAKDENQWLGIGEDLKLQTRTKGKKRVHHALMNTEKKKKQPYNS